LTASMVLMAWILSGCFNSGPPPAPKPTAAQVAAQQAARAEREAAAKRAAEQAAREQAEREAAERAAADRAAAELAAARAETRRLAHLEESSQRFLLLTPTGPLVARVYLTMDGQPYRKSLSERVDVLEDAADTNGDGRPTWEEALDNPEFDAAPFAERLARSSAKPTPDPAKQPDETSTSKTSPDEPRPGDPTPRETPPDEPQPAGREVADALDEVARSIEDEAERRSLIRQWDLDRDGTTDRDELVNLVVLRERNSDDFDLDADPYARTTDPHESAVWRLLDADGDGAFSNEEFAAAEARLKSRDADDDDLLYPEELTAETAAMMQPGMMPSRGDANTPPVVLRLDRRDDWSTIRFTLSEQYTWNQDHARDSQTWLRSLIDRLDANEDGQVQGAEFNALATIAPHIELEANFGETGELPEGVRLVSLAAELVEAPASSRNIPGGVALALPGVKLRFFSNDAPPIDYQQLAQQQLAALDTDKNGYIEKSELPDDSEQALANFDMADADGDGKLYAEEIAALAEKQAPARRRLRATTAGQGDALFAALDASNDGRLSLREMRHAAERLRAMDLDGDGTLSSHELPASIGLSFARVADEAMNAQPQAPAAMVSRPPPPVNGPPWFVRMDSNGDGDISPREFLGDADQFQRLDANGDGFIDAAEATAIASADAS
jgi:Ca2+-binding EF-hand superfamily protein